VYCAEHHLLVKACGRGSVKSGVCRSKGKVSPAVGRWLLPFSAVYPESYRAWGYLLEAKYLAACSPVRHPPYPSIPNTVFASLIISGSPVYLPGTSES
jgi:hypothetical protein